MIKSFSEKYGPWAMITGASSGIGEAFCFALADIGINLILIARSEDKLRDLSAKLQKKFNIGTKLIIADLSMKESFDIISGEIESFDIGLLVNNAGIGYTGTCESMEAGLVAEMININCYYPAVLSNLVIPKMKARGKGGIIFLGSLVANVPSPQMNVYSATKSFNKILAVGLWPELRKFNVDVLCINPGSTLTKFKGLGINKNNPMVRLPEQVVETAMNALGKHITITDGIINKITVQMSKFVPEKILMSLTNLISQKIYEKYQ